MILDAATKSIEVLLTTAQTTNPMPVVADYSDWTVATLSFAQASSDTQTNGTTAVTVLSGVAGVQRTVKALEITNADTVAKTLTVRLNNNGTFRSKSFGLNVGDVLAYTDTRGFYVITASGTTKQGTDSAPYSGGFNNLCAVGGTANAITLTPLTPLTSYASNVGMEYSFVATGTNTTAVTVAISGLAALSTTMGIVALPVGGIVSGRRYRAVVESATSIRISPFDAVSVDGDTLNGNLTYTTGLSDNTATLDLADAKFVKSQIAADTNAHKHSQSVVMTAATSGSTGITVADNANADMGTGNFTPVWDGTLPDWTPASTVILKQKSDGTNGFVLSLLSTGIIRLTINVTNYDSTVATGLADGSSALLQAAVTRESATTAGSVVFSVNGVVIGASVPITAASPTTVDNAAPLYVLGTSATRTAGTTKLSAIANRALSAAEMLDLYRNGITYADKWGSQTNTLSWTNLAGANGFETFTVSGADVTSGINTSAYGIATSPINSGKNYTLNGTLTINSVSGGSLYIAIAPSTDLTSNRITVVTASAPGVYAINVTFNAAGANSTNGNYLGFVTSSNSTLVDFSTSGFKLVQAGFTLALESEGIQADKWYDSSSNGLNATYPASGSSLYRQETPRAVSGVVLPLGLLASSATAGIGYTTGAGGTVTQATSKATGVTLSKVCGEITLNAASLAAGAIVSFVLTNTAIAATDTLNINHTSVGTFGAYGFNARCAAGSATIDVRNHTAGALAEAIVIRFTLTKGVIA